MIDSCNGNRHSSTELEQSVDICNDLVAKYVMMKFYYFVVCSILQQNKFERGMKINSNSITFSCFVKH